MSQLILSHRAARIGLAPNAAARARAQALAALQRAPSSIGPQQEAA
ncbi:hypothetical protein AWB82_02678 [Caballeronia glebae]|uniref:Uncharacterized protein n=1 Tax=Caballeronia glebae TaxID=1777143 RepID=A0A158APF4_9BURK|nr:hypothetical protein [Caballeronia glebae]SAK59540.1 hypothetical protein AWB82_02678 [Caballeronia glebae]